MLSWYEDDKRIQKSINSGIPVAGNTKRRAEEARKQLLAEYEEKYEVQEVKHTKEILYSEYIVNWLNDQKSYIELSSWEGYNSIIINHIVPYFKELKVTVQDLRPEQIQKYYTSKLESGLSPTTIKRHHANIRKSLQDALIQNIIAYNPADRVRLPKAQKYEAKFYGIDQMKKLLEVSHNTTLEPAIIFAVYYGLRREEVAGIQWKYIDFTNKTIEIKHTVTRMATTIPKDRTKNQSSRRTLPLLPDVKTYLINLKKVQEENKELLGSAYSENDYVCKWNDGREISPNYISQTFKTLLEKNNMPHIRYHDLRHSNISMLIRDPKIFCVKRIKYFQTDKNEENKFKSERKYFFMEKMPKELLKEYVNSQNFTSTADIMDAMKEMFKDALQQVMNSELDEKLGYEKAKERQKMTKPVCRKITEMGIHQKQLKLKSEK